MKWFVDNFAVIRIWVAAACTLGLYSILVMMVPYCMIHFGKPMPETFAAIVAGLFLGWLSFKNGNIWMGLVLHCVVAFSMDILALYNKGLLF